MEEVPLKKSRNANIWILFFFIPLFFLSCKKDRKPPEIGPIEMCVNDVGSKAGEKEPQCVCAFTTGSPFTDEKHLTYQNFRAVILSSHSAMRYPIYYCDKMIGFKPDYWFILQNWIHDLLTYIKNYCANLIE